MKANKILITILLFLAMLISAEACVDCDTYIFLTAAIDGPSFDADGSYIYLNPCTIDVDGVTKTGIPGAAFEVTSNEVHIITYSKEGYVTDKDDIFIDSRIRNCGTTCHYEYCHFITECEYRSQKDDWVCVATDTQTGQHITFVYTTHYPGLDETVLFINPMYPGECIPGHTEQRQCGLTDIGECEYGTQERVCQQDLYWGSWGSCVGAIYPVDEICDGKDNDCDGLVDECGVCWECIPGEQETISCYEGPGGTEGIGLCSAGTKTRTCDSEGQWGQYGECTGAVYPVDEICDGLDNDCDGLIDDGLTQPTTCGVGECSGNIGYETCTAGVWGNDNCNPYGGATAEICDGKDNDCDGLTDEDGVCWICTPGEQETISCYEGPQGTQGVGLCSAGTKTRTCDSEGQWGQYGGCTGAVYPVEEICDGLDNDCDGLIDEHGVCYIPLPDVSSMIGMARFNIINDDYLRPGDSIIILATLKNKGDINLEDIRLTFTVLELDMRRRVGPFDLKHNKEITKLVILDIPYWAEPGYYDIRATASNGNARKVKHREIIIHN